MAIPKEQNKNGALLKGLLQYFPSAIVFSAAFQFTSGDVIAVFLRGGNFQLASAALGVIAAPECPTIAGPLVHRRPTPDPDGFS